LNGNLAWFSEKITGYKLRIVAFELGVKIHAAGNVEDHIHVDASFPPKFAVADCIKNLKGASAYAVNHMDRSDGLFKWQEGYGALSIGERSLEKVMAYKAGQKEHRREKSIIAVYERMEKEENSLNRRD
jgi:putative transposase